MKPGLCTGAASSVAGARSSTCVPDSHILTGRTADPRGPRASAMDAHEKASDVYEAALARLNLPTEADLDTLTRQIAELEAKIDQLAP